MVAVLLVADLLIEFAESVEEWSKQKSRVFDHASLYGLVRQLGLVCRLWGGGECACFGGGVMGVMCVMGVRGEGGDDKADKRQKRGWEESRLHCFPLVNVDVTSIILTANTSKHTCRLRVCFK
jgi:hypothetical protein